MAIVKWFLRVTAKIYFDNNSGEKNTIGIQTTRAVHNQGFVRGGCPLRGVWGASPKFLLYNNEISPGIRKGRMPLARGLGRLPNYLIILFFRGKILFAW